MANYWHVKCTNVPLANWASTWTQIFPSFQNCLNNYRVTNDVQGRTRSGRPFKTTIYIYSLFLLKRVTVTLIVQ